MQRGPGERGTVVLGSTIAASGYSVAERREARFQVTGPAGDGSVALRLQLAAGSKIEPGAAIELRPTTCTRSLLGLVDRARASDAGTTAAVVRLADGHEPPDGGAPGTALISVGKRSALSTMLSSLLDGFAADRARLR